MVAAKEIAVMTAAVRTAGRREARTCNFSNMSPTIADITLIARSASVLAAEVDGEIVMMSIEHGRYFGLDDIASAIWKRIDPPCPFGDLIDRLAAEWTGRVD